jgi:hypothetical protein
MLTKKGTESTPKFFCEVCDFKCSKKSYWDRHTVTAKHSKLTTVNIFVTQQEDEQNKTYDCPMCNKTYKSRVGLWKHSKNCKVAEPEPKNDKEFSAELELKTLSLLVVDLMKSNHELQKQMLEVCKNSNTNNSNNNNNNHSHNKTFNLQFFLNEQCKDAMNIMDFVNTFQLQFSDLEKIGEVGYVEGISNIIIDKLNQMDIYKRPIHCSDAKRETMHIKDNDVWEKDNENYDKLRLAIKHITKKNTDMINPWAEKHPGVRDSDHRLNDKYQEMIIEAMGGKNNKTMREGESKIIKKISKMVLIDKTTF